MVCIEMWLQEVPDNFVKKGVALLQSSAEASLPFGPNFLHEKCTEDEDDESRNDLFGPVGDPVVWIKCEGEKMPEVV
jgi:hypothetical protein